MTREEQVYFCKKCLNSKMSKDQGLICKLTDARADFQNECPDFKLDETVKTSEPDKQEIIEKLRLDQRLIPGILAGVIVGIIGAILWGTITVITEYQIGYMALAVGAGVGFSIQYVGKGIDQIFGISGAIIALFSVILGNFFSIIGFIANAEGLGYIETLTLIDFAFIPDLMAETFSGMDLFFYALAVVEGYKFAFRKITEENLMEISQANS